MAFAENPRAEPPNRQGENGRQDEEPPEHRERPCCEGAIGKAQPQRPPEPETETGGRDEKKKYDRRCAKSSPCFRPFDLPAGAREQFGQQVGGAFLPRASGTPRKGKFLGPGDRSVDVELHKSAAGPFRSRSRFPVFFIVWTRAPVHKPVFPGILKRNPWLISSETTAENATTMLKRTHTCGDLTLDHVGQTVILNGWVDAWRDFGGLVFIDVRDRYGLTQCVFEPEVGDALQSAARELRNEYVVAIQGVVAPRLPGKENPKLKTGALEVRAKALEVLNATPTPPFDIQGARKRMRSLRLKYRYLDLRRPAMQEVFLLRHRMAQLMRNIMSAEGFIEVETPILGRSTPEGARDFLVPSRVHPGHFYALPQSPQIYKQLLMIAGFDRYFQIARCFRDEDLRANRQPEFTQLDVELSFVEDQDVMTAMEPLVAAIAQEFSGEAPTLPLLRLDYHDVMEPLRQRSARPALRRRVSRTSRTLPRRPSSRSSSRPKRTATGSVACALRAERRNTAAKTLTASRSSPGLSAPRGWSGSRSRPRASRDPPPSSSRLRCRPSSANGSPRSRAT